MDYTVPGNIPVLCHWKTRSICDRFSGICDFLVFAMALSSIIIVIVAK